MPYTKVASVWKPIKAGYTKVSGSWRSWWLQGGINDASFASYDITQGPEDHINKIVTQPDGKTIVSGSFLMFNGTTTNKIARLNSDGSLDTAFTTNNGTGINGSLDVVQTIALQSDGKIIVAGSFTSFNGTTANGIARLNSDGTLDAAFATNIGSGPNDSEVRDIGIQSDGKIVVVGNFTTFNGTTVNRIVRLNSDGTRDVAFTTNTGSGTGSDPSSQIFTITIQSDQKILLGGFFDSFNGTAVNKIVRLNSSGTVDTTFSTSFASEMTSGILFIKERSDSSLIVYGYRYSPFGPRNYNVVAVSSTGVPDSTFNTNVGAGPSTDVYSLNVQPDGKVLVSGYIQTWNNIPFDVDYSTKIIIRLNSNGTLDNTFNNNISFTSSSTNDGSITDISLQSDGKILLGGSFAVFNGAGVRNIARLNSNGTVDTSFLIGKLQAVNDNINTIALQSDKKILLGGRFTRFGETVANHVVRLNPDGTLDTAFASNVGTGATVTDPFTVAYVNAIAVQSDGKILLGGSFTSWNGTTVNRIVRLNSDGTRDTTFTTNTGTGANNDVTAITIQPNGQILVGGLFSTFNGATVVAIVRLNSNGTRDTTFTTNAGTGFSGGVLPIAVQSDGKILLGGFFTTLNGTTVNRIVRLNSDGTRDTTFTTNAGSAANGSVLGIAIQTDGKIVICGSFSTWNGVTVNRIVRLNSDGTRDVPFTTNTGTGSNQSIIALAVQSDGKILLGGGFSTWNGTTVNKLVRLNSDGTRDTAFTTNTGTGISSGRYASLLNTIALDSDGKIILGGQFISFNQTGRSYVARIGGDLIL